MKGEDPAFAVLKNLWTPVHFKLTPNFISAEYSVKQLLSLLKVTTPDSDSASPLVRLNG
jgi:hypothetical protein